MWLNGFAWVSVRASTCITIWSRVSSRAGIDLVLGLGLDLRYSLG
jgi:hypothetical protein